MDETTAIIVIIGLVGIVLVALVVSYWDHM